MWNELHLLKIAYDGLPGVCTITSRHKGENSWEGLPCILYKHVFEEHMHVPPSLNYKSCFLSSTRRPIEKPRFTLKQKVQPALLILGMSCKFKPQKEIPAVKIQIVESQCKSWLTFSIGLNTNIAHDLNHKSNCFRVIDNVIMPQVLFWFGCWIPLLGRKSYYSLFSILLDCALN